MKPKIERIRPQAKWHGGKFYLAPKIVPYFGPHHTYVEPFGGSASVLLNKERSPVEVYNDLDTRIVRFFRVLRDHDTEFRRRLALTPYSEAEFEAALTPAEDEVEQARRDFVRWRQSIGGRGRAFSFTLHRVRRDMVDVVSGFRSMVEEELPRIVERLRTVQYLNRPALDVIRAWDGERTLFYCDPPYVPSTRSEGSREVYACEMTEQDHRELAAVLNAVRGRVVLSGYPSELYDELYQGWRVAEFDMANHASGGRRKARTRERIWMNW
jgi:DNA adenine methylase